MTSPTYARSAAAPTTTTKPNLMLHIAAHASVACAYLFSIFVAWGLNFHPFSESLHGYVMLLGSVIVATMAFGPAHTVSAIGDIRQQQRWTRIYHILSPIWGALTLVGLIALWVLAFNESYTGSVLA